MGIIYSTRPLQARRKFDHYPTPSGLVRASLALPQVRPNPIKVLDPGAGTGVWGSLVREKWPNSFITGIELQPCVPNDTYDVWNTGDFFRWSANHACQKYDLIVGNPPYGGICKDMAEMFVRTCIAHLGPGGQIVFLLRSAFFESISRGRDLFKNHQPTDMYQCMRRPSFTGNNKTDSTAYSLFLWQKGQNPEYTRAWHLDWEYGESIEEDKPFKPFLLLEDSHA